MNDHPAPRDSSTAGEHVRPDADGWISGPCLDAPSAASAADLPGLRAEFPGWQIEFYQTPAGDQNDFYIRRPRCAETEKTSDPNRPTLAECLSKTCTSAVPVLRSSASSQTSTADVHPELEARISEAAYRGDFKNIDPHHITTALRELSKEGKIEWVDERTRGGSTIKTIQPTDTQLIRTKVAAAAARKRLLYARYSGWSQGTKRYPQGLVGPAGEEAVRRAIRDSGALQPAAPGAGEVNSLLGVTLPGPLDSAGYLVPFDASGLPQSPVTILFEVKNLRSWIYPSSEELWVVPTKANRSRRFYRPFRRVHRNGR